MRWKTSGQYYNIDIKNPVPLAMCDHSFKKVPHNELVKQMEWRGNKLAWTGLMVHYTEVDEPQPQLRPPPVIRDQKPIKNPRPMLYRTER